MRKYFVRAEKNHYVPPGTEGHGFNGYLDLSLNDPEVLQNQTSVTETLKGAAKVLGDDPEDLLNLVRRDLNSNDPDRDFTTGIFGFPLHKNLEGRR